MLKTGAHYARVSGFKTLDRSGYIPTSHQEICTYCVNSNVWNFTHCTHERIEYANGECSAAGKRLCHIQLDIRIVIIILVQKLYIRVISWNKARFTSETNQSLLFNSITLMHDRLSQRLVGEVGAQRLVGVVGAQRLVGEVGAQGLVGEVGAQRLVGEVGAQRLVGEVGARNLVRRSFSRWVLSMIRTWTRELLILNQAL